MAPKHILPARGLLLFFVLSFQTNMGVNGKPSTLSELGLDPTQGTLTMKDFGSSNTDTTNNEMLISSNSRKAHSFDQLIVEGHPTYVAEFAYQIALLVNTSKGLRQICGAVLISERHILTAAHCMALAGSYDYFVAAGVYNLTLGINNPGSQVVQVASYQIHPFYSKTKPGYPNDICMLYVDTPITENDYVKYAVLASPDMGPFERSMCVVTGWGYTQNGFPEILQLGYQYIPTRSDCKAFWAISQQARVSKKHLCGYFYPTSFCRGDNGGPLSCDGVTVGLVSWGLANCSGCFPGVYTRISYHYWWILKFMEL